MRKPAHPLDEHQDETPFFLSTGDLMAALLMIFVLLLSVTLLRLHREYDRKSQTADAYKRTSQEYKQVSENYEKIVTTYRQLQNDLYADLWEEFQDDLPQWQASVDRETLSIRFREPEVLFAQGEDEVTGRFKTILDNFFPRYIRVLMSDKYRDSVEEIRIEGHTSSEWESDVGSQQAYFNNMELSQNRTRKTLEYCLGRIDDPPMKDWIRTKITANGLSSSKPIMVNGVEDKVASRRVEFRALTDAEKRIAEILRLATQAGDPDPSSVATAPTELGR